MLHRESGEEGSAPSGKAGNRSEQTLECLRHMMRDEVFVHWSGRNRGPSAQPKFAFGIDKRHAPCIMVVHEAFALLSDVSPHSPMTATANASVLWRDAEQRRAWLLKHTLLVFDEGTDEIVKRERIDNSVGVNHQQILHIDDLLAWGQIYGLHGGSAPRRRMG